ncbi:NnrS multi-domain protein [Streptomyces mirabilis]|uniref:NnrS multi-domain protein n=1 Tax=Streptomyces mirabilis TaxID=68239 RepID=UPI0035DB3081
MRARYDQRALAVVEVRGEERDWEQAEGEFQQRGWPVITSSARGEAMSAGVLRRDPASRLYCVEVRLFGAHNKRTEHAAAWRVQRLAHTSLLEMYVRRCDLIDRDRELLTEWRVHTTGHRPPLRPVPHPVGVRARMRRRWALLWARFSERRGCHDTGTVVTGTASEARRLARMSLPAGTAPNNTDIDVRAHQGKERRHIVPRREDDRNRHVYRLLAWLLAMTFCAVVARRHGGGHRSWVWGVLAALFFLGAMRVGSRLFLSGGRGLSVFVVSVAAALLLAGALGLASSEAEPWTPTQMAVAAATVFTVIGVWLLIRQWSLGEWLAWVAPLVFTVVVSLVVASGSVLHALYADALGFTPDELDVPGIWQVLAAAKLLSFLSLALFVPAGWGIAKHIHVAFLRPGELLNVPLYVVMQASVIGLVAVLAINSAQDAVDAVKHAAHEREEPPPYFGVQPEWTCVEPTVSRATLNVQGGEVHPAHPYLSFGLTGDTVLLWNPATDTPLKLPVGQVRLLPARDGRATCGFPARRWEAGVPVS